MEKEEMEEGMEKKKKQESYFFWSLKEKKYFFKHRFHPMTKCCKDLDLNPGGEP